MNNDERGDTDGLNCLLQFSMPDAYTSSRQDEHPGMLDLPLPGEDELMDLLDTTPSDSNSAGFNFYMPSPMIDNKFSASPAPQTANQRDNAQLSRPETTSPPDYNMVRIHAKAVVIAS